MLSPSSISPDGLIKPVRELTGQRIRKNRKVFRFFQSPKRGRRSSALSDNGIYPLVALEGGTRKTLPRADAEAASST